MLGDVRRVRFGCCPDCGYLMLPVTRLSPCGHDDAPQLEPLTAPGIVYSWTQVWTGDQKVTMVMVDFLGGKLRVNGPLVGGNTVQIGETVEIIPGLTSPVAFRRPDK